MPKALWIFCIALFLFKTQFIETHTRGRSYTLVFYNMTCNKLSQSLKLLECDLLKVASGSYLFSARMVIAKKGIENFFMRFKVDVTPITKFRKTLNFVDISFKGCNDVDNENEMPLMKYVIQEMRRVGNLPFQCPFKEDYLYQIQNFSFSEKYLATSLPHINFSTVVDLRNGTAVMGTVRVKGAILPKNNG